MVRVITVEREYGSQGAEFGHRLAAELNWKLIDHCMVEDIAHKIGVKPQLVKNCDERLDPWYYRVGRAFWHGSLERTPTIGDANVLDSERMVSLVREYLQDKAKAGNCVVIGRGAASVLSGIPGCFHIFVYASLSRKIRWVEENFPENAKIAEQEILATDKRRANYVRRFHQQEWTDRRLYHLMMNSCMGMDAMVGATMNAAGLIHSHAS
jgi:hypothetical protein